MSAKIIRIFLDSNIWFSAFYGSDNCRKLILAHEKGKIRAVVSILVIDEILRNTKKKLLHQYTNLQDFLLSSPPEIITNPENIPKELIKLVSAGDLPILASALQAKVKYFVTGNIKHFQVDKLKKHTGIQIITPKEAVKLLKL